MSESPGLSPHDLTTSCLISTDRRNCDDFSSHAHTTLQTLISSWFHDTFSLIWNSFPGVEKQKLMSSTQCAKHSGLPMSEASTETSDGQRLIIIVVLVDRCAGKQPSAMKMRHRFVFHFHMFLSNHINNFVSN